MTEEGQHGRHRRPAGRRIPVRSRDSSPAESRVRRRAHSGFKNAAKDLIFYTDGDGQYDVREIHNLLAQLRPNIDLVNGYKVKRSDAWYRI